MNRPAVDYLLPARAFWLAAKRYREQYCADLAVLMTGAAVLGLFAVSPIMLEHFQIAYLTAGGGALSKFHPATFCAIAALVLRCLAAKDPVRTGWTLITRDVNVVILGIAVAIAGTFCIVITKTPVTPLVDTFLLPIIFLLLLRNLNPAVLRWLAVLLVLLFCINAVIALYEFLNATHVVQLPMQGNVSSDPTRANAIFDWRAELMQDWRATALLGHPLVNGLIVGGFILCLFAPGSNWLWPAVKAPLVLLQSASMFAFGARASLVLTIVFAIYLAFGQGLQAFRSGRRVTPRIVGIALICAVVLIGVGIAMQQTGFFDRTIERFGGDEGSAKTRAIMFQLFQPLSWTDLVFGPSQEVVATWQRLYGLEFGIESTWIGLTLTYGLLVTAFLIVGLFVFSRSVVKASGRGVSVLLVFFFISISGTTGLSGKTTLLAMTVVLAILFLQKDERRLSLRSDLSV